jgi:hypothetical protein
MISLGIFAAITIAYWLGRPDISFWIVVFCIANGVLGMLRAITNRAWYENQAIAAGVEPNFAMLITTKIVTFVVLLWAAWFTGTAAHYL